VGATGCDHAPTAALLVKVPDRAKVANLVKVADRVEAADLVRRTGVSDASLSHDPANTTFGIDQRRIAGHFHRFHELHIGPESLRGPMEAPRRNAAVANAG
jgi:hypothetical protein